MYGGCKQVTPVFPYSAAVPLNINLHHLQLPALNKMIDKLMFWEHTAQSDCEAFSENQWIQLWLGQHCKLSSRSSRSHCHCHCLWSLHAHIHPHPLSPLMLQLRQLRDLFPSYVMGSTVSVLAYLDRSSCQEPKQGSGSEQRIVAHCHTHITQGCCLFLSFYYGDDYYTSIFRDPTIIFSELVT